MKAKPRSCFSCPFFFSLPLPGVSRGGGRGLQSCEGNRQGVETPPIGQKHGWRTQWALPFRFQHSRVHVMGKGNGGREAESMLETCAVVPDPPCHRRTDSTGSVWVREAAGTHKDDLFTNLSN